MATKKKYRFLKLSGRATKKDRFFCGFPKREVENPSRYLVFRHPSEIENIIILNRLEL